MKVVKIENLVKRYGDLVAVDHFNLEIEEGEIFGLLGPNGSGKSTTIHCLLSLLSYDKGHIEIFGQEMTPASYDIKKDIGIIMQNVAVFQELTVYENIDYFCGLYVPEKGQRKRLVEEAIEFAGLSEFRKFYPKKLSGGLLRRLNIACGIAHKPKLIILDEPTVGLDPAQMIEIRSLIRDLGKTHTDILSSHILSEVQTVCDRVLIIAHGRLVAQGTPEELAAQLTAKGTITATAQGSREAVVAAAGKVPGLTDLRVTDEKGGEVSFTAVSTAGTDLRGALSLALAQAGCPVLSLSAETMSLEDVFLQLTETPESGKPESAAAPAENPPAEAAAEEENEKEADSDESNL